MNTNKTLNNYIEDINEIFHYTKKEYGYDSFAKTCKKAFHSSIETCREEAIKGMKEFYHNMHSDPIVLIEFLNLIQEKTKELLILYKVQDEAWKDKIYSMAPDIQRDSHLAYNFDKEFRFIIK